MAPDLTILHLDESNYGVHTKLILSYVPDKAQDSSVLYYISAYPNICEDLTFYSHGGII